MSVTSALSGNPGGAEALDARLEGDAPTHVEVRLRTSLRLVTLYKHTHSPQRGIKSSFSIASSVLGRPPGVGSTRRALGGGRAYACRGSFPQAYPEINSMTLSSAVLLSGKSPSILQ